MTIRIVINGTEVESPLARFFVGLLALVGLTVLGVVFVAIVLPLIGITLVLSFGLFVIILLVSFFSLLVALTAYQQHHKKQTRLDKK